MTRGTVMIDFAVSSAETVIRDSLKIGPERQLRQTTLEALRILAEAGMLTPYSRPDDRRMWPR